MGRAHEVRAKAMAATAAKKSTQLQGNGSYVKFGRNYQLLLPLHTPNSRLKGRIVGKGMAPAMDYGSWSGAMGLEPRLFGI